MELYIFAFIGVIIHYGLLFDSARRKPDFDIVIFLYNNLAMFILSAVISSIIVYQYNVATDAANAIIQDFLGKYYIFIQTIMLLVGYNAGDIWHRISKFKLFKRAVDDNKPKDEEED